MRAAYGDAPGTHNLPSPMTATMPENTKDGAWTAADLADPHHHAAKATKVRGMFSAIAGSYDLNNRVHSLWQDQAWRRYAVRTAGVKPGEAVLDSRVHGLLTFLREYVQRRLTPVRDVGQYDHLLWLTEMPSHGGAGTTLWGDTPPAFAGEEAWAWVPRPQEPVRPETPGALVHWLRFDPRDGGRSVHASPVNNLLSFWPGEDFIASNRAGPWTARTAAT